MRSTNKLLLTLAAAAALSACRGDGGSGGGGPTQRAETFTATVTSVEIVRSADALDMPVTGLPADGAELTVR
jgi:hypothetical protein